MDISARTTPTWLSRNILPSAYKIAYNLSYLGLKLNRLTRRYNHPYLYLAGVMSTKIIGNDSLFLSSTAKIIRIARILHDCMELSFQLTTAAQKFVQFLKKPIYGSSETYLNSIKKIKARKLFNSGESAPSLRYQNAKLALLACRCENLTSIAKNISKILISIASKIFELWQTFSENPQESAEDIFIEMNEILKKYDLENSSTLFSQLKYRKTEIEKAFSSFGLSIEMDSVLTRAESIYDILKAIQERAQRGARIGSNALSNASAILGMTPRSTPEQKNYSYILSPTSPYGDPKFSFSGDSTPPKTSENEMFSSMAKGKGHSLFGTL